MLHPTGYRILGKQLHVAMDGKAGLGTATLDTHNPARGLDL
jgi:hypothetical protein